MSNEVKSTNAAASTNETISDLIEKQVTKMGEEKKVDSDKIRFSEEEFKTLQPHPYAGFLPMIASKHEVEALKEGIRVHGLLEPITIHEGQILDGRNRHRAICELMKYEKDFEYEEYVKFISVPEGISPEQYVISRNLHRRNLNESQRALFAGQMLMAFNEDRTLSKAERTILPKGSKTGHFGKIFNVSGSSVKSAQFVINNGLPILRDFVMKGVWRVSLAKKIAELKPEEQQQLVPEALNLGHGLANNWYAKYVLGLNNQELKLQTSLTEEEEKREALADTLRQRLTQELAEANHLSGEEQAKKRKEIDDKVETIVKGTHPNLKGFTTKINNLTKRLETCRNELKKMQNDETNQKELYAQSKLAQCMIGSYKQYMRSQNKASLVVAMNFTGNAPEVEFKVVPAGQASKFLGTIKEFSNPGEGEKFRAANKAELDALKIEILNGTLANAPVKIQTFGGGLLDSKIA